MPASRQKNCNSCVQSKRRCDRRTPVCSRCAEKKVRCVYSKAKVASRHGGCHGEPTVCTEAQSFGSPACSLFDPGLCLDGGYLGGLSMDSRPDAAADSTLQHFMDAPGGGDIPMDTFMDMVGGNSSTPPDQWLVPAHESLFTERPATPADEEIVSAYEKMTSVCVSTRLGGGGGRPVVLGVSSRLTASRTILNQLISTTLPRLYASL